ncbi:MAG: hypothetical protein ACLGG0_14685 [Bacteriovoracia bacterium]
MIKVLGLVGVLIFGIEHTYAFNGKQCWKFLYRWYHFGVPVFTGTSQYSSSTGACSAISMSKEEQAQHFYAFNQDKILEDIAKSRGDYLASFERILGCKVGLAGLRKNYAELALKHVDDQYLAIKDNSSCDKGKSL